MGRNPYRKNAKKTHKEPSVMPPSATPLPLKAGKSSDHLPSFSERGQDLSLYFHWPFCAHKCPYCDFNSYTQRGPLDQRQWQDAFIQSIDESAEKYPNRVIRSIFFGGGTPSLMPENLCARLIDRVARRWSLGPDVEITLEANPGSCDQSKLTHLRKSGVNRLSIGVQSLDPERLAFLGRRHSVEEAIRAMDMAVTTFPRTSLDMIYATPGQSLDAWTKELGDAGRIAGQHMSCYQLTIEPGTPFHERWQKGRLRAIDDDQAERLYRRTEDVLRDHGFDRYEISNYGRDADQSRHNITYWQYGDYLGIGPGAHSRMAHRHASRTQKHRDHPRQWLDDALQSRHPVWQHIDRFDTATEMLIMGLRLKAGIDRRYFHHRSGLEIDRFLNPSALDTFQDRGWIILDRHTLRVTDAGIMLLDSILCDLVPDRPTAQPTDRPTDCPTDWPTIANTSAQPSPIQPSPTKTTAPPYQR